MPAATLTITTLLARVFLALAIAALVSPTTAQDASVDPQDLTNYFTKWKMALALETEENAPIGSQYDVIPLTIEAGFQQMDLSKVGRHLFYSVPVSPATGCFSLFVPGQAVANHAPPPPDTGCPQ